MARILIVLAALVAFAALAACPVPPTVWFWADDGEPTPTWWNPNPSTPTEMPTTALCDPAPCDEPGAVQFDGSFTISDDGMGGRTVSGSWSFLLWEFDGQSLGSSPICSQSWSYTADFLPLESTEACESGGANCVQICPFDSPADVEIPVGQCSGHMDNFVAVDGSYVTDCRFVNPVDWFHPESGLAGAILESFVYSFPVEPRIDSGLQTVGSWLNYATLLTDPFGGIFPNEQPSQQVTFVNGSDGDWSTQAFLMGLTLQPRGEQPLANAVGTHNLQIPFLLVFR